MQIPPITLTELKSTIPLLKSINEFVRFMVYSPCRGEGIHFQTYCTADQEAVVAFLKRTKDANFIWHQPKMDNTRRLIIRGVDSRQDLQEVENNLKDQGTPVLHRMQKRQENGTLRPIELIKLETDTSNETAEHLAHITHIGYETTNIEPQKKYFLTTFQALWSVGSCDAQM